MKRKWVVFFSCHLVCSYSASVSVNMYMLDNGRALSLQPFVIMSCVLVILISAFCTLTS